ncbi:LysR family transcriptional regulator [Amnibacterium kyonggiense]
MEQLEMRELRYFIAVAELLHFGQAAARLRIAQPALSKTVQRIEARLGTDLFVRSSRRVALTPAGELLLEHGRHALNAMDAAVRRVQQAAATERLRLVMKPGGDAGLLTDLLAAYAEHADARQVDVIFAGGADRSRLIRDGSADVGLLYAPFDDLDGLASATLHSEHRVAVLPASHRLAGQQGIRADELAGETFPRWTGIPAEGATGPEIADVAELLPLVRIGQVIAVLPASLVAQTPPDIACVPVTDAGRSRIVLAWRTDEHRESVNAFLAASVRAVRAARERGDPPLDERSGPPA